MSDTDMDKNAENKEETRSETIERLFAEKKADEAMEQINLFLAEEPENLDAHAWTAVTCDDDSQSIHHYTFVFDRDIRYDGPYKAIEKREWSARKRFLFALMMKMHGRGLVDNELEASKRRGMAEMLVDYSEKFLTAGMNIHSIEDFAEALAIVGRYDDVIKLGQYVTENVKAEALGWTGLWSTRDYARDETGEIVTFVLDSYYLTERYAEGCKWIHEVILNKKSKEKYDYYLWYLLGWTLGWLGYPEETARAWIISVSKGNAAFDTSEHFTELSMMIADRDYKKKDQVHSRFFKAKKLIAPEKESVYKEMQSLVYGAINDANQDMPTVEFIENKLGITLPPESLMYSRYDRILENIGHKRSNDPVVKEVLATLDREAGAAAAKSKDSRMSGKGPREKVRVGGAASLAGGSTLEQFGIDLTSQAAKGEIPPIVGREREIDRMIRILSRAEKNNPVLLGEAGVGKTAIVQGLAQRIASGNVPDDLREKIVIELNVGVLVAGTQYRGDFESRMTNIMKETRENSNIILFIDELHTLMGSGDKKNGLDGSNILKPALASGDLRLIGATTPGEYSRSIEKDPAMDRRFSPVWLSEIDKEMTRAVLGARRALWENHHAVVIEEDVFNAAIQLTDQHVRHRHFPDKAIDAVDEACALVRTLNNTGEYPPTVKREHIVRVIDEWSGAETERASEKGNSLLREIRAQLESKIIGHEAILEKIVYLAADIKYGLRMSRLARVVCFAGAAQSGKTETACALAQVLWPDSREKFLYVNMKLLKSESDLNRLTGAARGYAGSDVGGVLTHHLRQHPHSIVYLYHFDEAHPKIKNFFGNLFLQGSFPDADGRSIHVGSTIFIVSVTLDSKAASIGFGPVKSSSRNGTSEGDDTKEMLKQRGIPESVVTSLSETLRFNDLTSEQIHKVIKRMYDEIISQPGIRDFQTVLTDEIIGTVAARYQSMHVDARNIHLVVNRELYREIGRVISR